MNSALVFRTIVGAALALAALYCGAQTASKQAASPGSAQAYPSRPIRLIIPFPPGGGADIAGRIVGQKLTERLGQQVVVDNRPGASTLIGTEITARATPDGYTLLMATSVHAINPSVYAKKTFDEIADFTPIVLVNTSPNVFAVGQQQPIRNLADLIAQAKAKPGAVKFGSGGYATLTHLVVEMLGVRAGVNLLHVPYKSVQTTGVIDAIGGEVAMVVASVPAFLPWIKNGRLRGIAVTSARRSPALPDVPTVAEQGFPGYAVDYWLGLVGPAGIPPPIVKRINEETNALLKQADVRESFSVQGAEAAGGTPEQFRSLMVREVKAWADVVKTVGIQPQ